ncbi:MAG: hypothetical protein SVU32_07960, partial [Candidatus Nanohaloarchaea archaeon]|nr:hypothetical protein [Candidatus Nanohaloarchaea archaeon]
MQDLFKKAGIFVFIISIVVLIGLAVIGGMPETESAQKGLIYSAIFFILGLEAVVFGFRGLWEKQLIKNTPTSKVRSLAMGLVEVNGTAEPAQDTVPSPVTGTPCLFYKYEVEERRKMDDDWNTVAEDTGGTSFLLDDGTGKVLIDPRDAELEVDRDEKVKIGAGEQPPAAVSQFADRISNSEGNMDAF